MPGNCRPSIIEKTLYHVKNSRDLSETDKKCIKSALEKQIPKKPTTNYERIKAMSVEEMASFWADKIMQQECVLNVSENMRATVIEAVKRDIFRKCIRWLESEVQENDT